MIHNFVYYPTPTTETVSQYFPSETTAVTVFFSLEYIPVNLTRKHSILDHFILNNI